MPATKKPAWNCREFGLKYESMKSDPIAFKYDWRLKRTCDTMLDTGKLFHRIRDFMTRESTPLKAIFCSHRSMQYCQLRIQSSSNNMEYAYKNFTVQMKCIC
jgi:hypothetical protein